MATTPHPEPAGPKSPRRRSRRVSALLGIGLDGKDGHTRITQGEHFLLAGGSAETHERMQDFTIRLAQRLAESGKTFASVSVRELRDLAKRLK